MNSTGKKYLIPVIAAITLVVVVAVVLAITLGGEGKKNPSVTTGGEGTAVVIPGRDNTNAAVIQGSVTAAGLSSSEYSSVNGVAILDDVLYISDETRKNITAVKNGEVIHTYSSELAVNGLFVYSEGVFSLEGGLGGKVVKLSLELEKISEVSVGHTPEDAIVTDNKLFVANRFSGTVSVIDISAMSLVKNIEIDGREPNSLAISGGNLYVGCHLSDEATTEKVMSANVCVVDLATLEVTDTIKLVNGASGVKDICASPDGSRIYVSHVIGRYTYPTTQLDRGWINTNGFSIIDTKTKSLYCTVLIDEVDEGTANPWGITVSSDGKYLCVAASGTNELAVVDIDAMNTRITKVVKGTGLVKTLDDIVDYIPFLADIMTRIEVGTGVREIAEKDGKVYCGLYFDGRVDVVDLASAKVESSVKIYDQPEADSVRRGQILWSDANSCYQKWQSCNSCHPDAVVDGFNWDNLNDGLGNAKSAKSMLYSHRTPPVMITGIRPNAEVAVGAGMKFIQFNILPDSDLACIDEYLKSLYPVSSPYLNNDKTLTEDATSGKELFKANCASCHTGPLYTDMLLHDVGTGTANDNGSYDTPTLVEVWRTAPYMHDGSLGTIEEVVKYFAKDLSDDDVRKLSLYVKSIGNENEDYGVEQIFTDLNGSVSYNKYVNGAKVTGLTLRKQSETAGNGIVSVSIYNENGELVYYMDILLPTIAYNTKTTIVFDTEVILPENGKITVDFLNEEFETIASTIEIK